MTLNQRRKCENKRTARRAIPYSFSPNLFIALREIEQNIEHYARVKYGQEEPVYCGKCDYCKSVKEARIRNYSELLEGL